MMSATLLIDTWPDFSSVLQKNEFRLPAPPIINSFLLSRVSTLTRDIDIAILSVRPSVCPPVRNVPVSDENGLIYHNSFFHHAVTKVAKCQEVANCLR